jgi:hypothetical protein
MCEASGYQRTSEFGLNKLTPRESGWVLGEADGINDAGQIRRLRHDPRRESRLCSHARGMKSGARRSLSRSLATLFEGGADQQRDSETDPIFTRNAVYHCITELLQ